MDNVTEAASSPDRSPDSVPTLLTANPASPSHEPAPTGSDALEVPINPGTPQSRHPHHTREPPSGVASVAAQPPQSQGPSLSLAVRGDPAAHPAPSRSSHVPPTQPPNPQPPNQPLRCANPIPTSPSTCVPPLPAAAASPSSTGVPPLPAAGASSGPMPTPRTNRLPTPPSHPATCSSPDGGTTAQPPPSGFRRHPHPPATFVSTHDHTHH